MIWGLVVTKTAMVYISIFGRFDRRQLKDRGEFRSSFTLRSSAVLLFATKACPMREDGKIGVRVPVPFEGSLRLLPPAVLGRTSPGGPALAAAKAKSRTA
jgi:hypothetical protein